ncbi:MAG: alpha/beta hydrolase [Clostridia bacterium]|nr:alpha/beta hydrolase [Clostridia bacterium]
MWYLVGALAALALLVFLTALICFFKVFYSPTRKPMGMDDYPIPDGGIYRAHREQIVNWMKEIRQMDRVPVEVTSFDGLTLRGMYYECKKGAPVELLFHGYRGNAERDLSGGVERCFALGRNVILIDQRGGGSSDGHVTTFGINERLDCLTWVRFAIDFFGPDVKLVIGGVSMGAATVMMAAGEELPKNVVCVMADCGYTSAKEIISKVMVEMHLPPKLLYPFIRLGAKWFGRFDLDETSPMEAVQRSKTPIIFIHGDTDDFVPCDMSRDLYAACVSEKKLAVIHGAGHGLAYPVDKEGYLDALRQFEAECDFFHS